MSPTLKTDRQTTTNTQ